MPAASEKPLNVQVAEALGWKDCKPIRYYEPRWTGKPPKGEANQRFVIGQDHGSQTFTTYADCIPNFSESWCRTGPLIERFDLTVMSRRGAEAEWPHGLAGELVGDHPWYCWGTGPIAAGSTALEAVCRWIVANVKDGKVIGG